MNIIMNDLAQAQALQSVTSNVIAVEAMMPNAERSQIRSITKPRIAYIAYDAVDQTKTEVWTRQDEHAKCYRTTLSHGPEWNQVFRRVTQDAQDATTGETL